MFHRKKTQNRSPIQDRRINRFAGETLREELDELLSESCFLAGVGIVICLLSIAIFVFLATGLSVSPLAAGLLIVGVGSILLGIHRIHRLGRPIMRGLQAEQAAGQELQALENYGYCVIHDVPSFGRKGANIDHVLIGVSGVYAIETKWMTKNGDHHLDYDGSTILYNNRPIPYDPLPQARAVANDLKQIVETETGLSLDVIPVVLYPGWFVNNGQLRHTSGHVNVLSDKHFVQLVKNTKAEGLTRPQVASIRAGILRHAEGARRHGLHR